MLLLVVTLCAGAVPVEGSKWSWSIDDTRTTRVVPANVGASFTSHLTLGKAQFEFTVLSAGENGPKRIKLAVKKGPEAIAGTEWEVENNYGELIARRTNPPPGNTPGNKNEPSLRDWSRALSGAARLVMPDPILAAVSPAEPCSEKSRAAIADAGAQAIARVYFASGADEAGADTTISSQASCGSKPGLWNVKFKLDVNRGDNTISIGCSGTVGAPAGALFANYQLTCSGDSPVKFAHHDFRLKWNSGFKSSVAPLK